MPNTAVATDVHQAFYVELVFRTQPALYRVLVAKDAPQRSQFGIIPVKHFFIRIYLGFLQDFSRPGMSHPINVGECDDSPLIFR
jgi:hypothetical protein